MILKGSIWNPILTWTFNIGLLFANDHFEGYPWVRLSPILAWMDEYQGALTHWFVHWNIMTLRLISYNMDFYWSWKVKREELRSVSHSL